MMNPYEKLLEINESYHCILEEVFQIPISSENCDLLLAKAEFGARASQAMRAMEQTADVLKPFYTEE